ncbi:ScbR family autoregulator-binding transcription factor [Arthrobacter sp. TMN-49]
MVQMRAQSTRKALIRAGGVVFNREGYARATTSDIIHEAGVTKGAMQFHFRTKADLAHAVVAEYTRTFGFAAEAARADSPSSAGAVVELSAVIARQLVEDPIAGAAHRLRMEESPFAPRVTGPYLEVMDVLQRLFRAAVKEGDIRSGVNVQDLARYVVASFIGVQMVSDTLTSRTDLIQRVAEMWFFLLPSIAEPDRLRSLINMTRQTLVSHYATSRLDLVSE